MFNLKHISLLILLIAVVAGCGTDGIDAEQQQLAFNDVPDDFPAAQVDQQYSYTLQLENGPAENVRLTAFTENGGWLDAQVVNNGSAIELTGTPSSSNAWSFYNFYLAGTDANESTASTYFGIYVVGN